ncbi:hypothetical protein J8F10_10300 [Gemmata sp. G18]|uniref:TerB family tellurite resistance protein n=1 Tax=Gemmata palustris TaxID=2822762 RepID=A0ABS5BPL8_9BACT|nr:hypothetical protein [Gemmata palustris]MBP3955671.1 hypothetical protein [Gemmata palustris]
MSALRELKPQILSEGHDLHICDADVALIREHLPANGTIDQDDLMVLTEIRSEAYSSCAAFDELFFPAFKAYLLADGTISHHEQFLLLRMLYGGGGVDDTERRFLVELRNEVTVLTPEFEDLCRLALTTS